MKTPVVSSVDELIEWRLADIERGQEDMHAYQIEDYEFFKRTPFSIGIIGLGLGKSVIGATLLRDLIYEWEHDGLILIVDHGNGYMSLYAHNDTLLRDAGDRVKRGDALAKVGTSGGQGTPALYFELRRGGQPVDPSSWLQRR